MGVDYYTCDDCGDVFHDAGHFAQCESCSKHLCGDCMEKHGVGHSMLNLSTLSEEERAECEDLDQCPFCAAAIITDSDLLSFALEKLGHARAELEREFRDAQKRD